MITSHPMTDLIGSRSLLASSLLGSLAGRIFASSLRIVDLNTNSLSVLHNGLDRWQRGDINTFGAEFLIVHVPAIPSPAAEESISDSLTNALCDSRANTREDTVSETNDISDASADTVGKTGADALGNTVTNTGNGVESTFA
jgi:hypothetical protein